MPIVSSTSTEGAPQVDGRRYVRETHTISDGTEQTVMYLAPADWGPIEYAATMAARVPQIDAELAQAEFDQLVGE